MMGPMSGGLIDGWWSERAVTIVHALDHLLDVIDDRLNDCPEMDDPEDPQIFPLSTGILSLDRVLEGGLRPGTLTLVEADLAAQANALLCTVARLTPHRCQIDGPNFVTTVAWLLSGSAEVPEVDLLNARLSVNEWSRVQDGVVRLRDADLHISSVGTLGALIRVAQVNQVEILLVHDAERLARPVEFIQMLARFAQVSGTAVMAASGVVGELPRWVFRDVTRLAMHGYNLGGNAMLLRVDPDEMLVTAQVKVECLSGIVR